MVHIKTNNTGVRTGNAVSDLIALLDHECGEAMGMALWCTMMTDKLQGNV